MPAFARSLHRLPPAFLLPLASGPLIIVRAAVLAQRANSVEVAGLNCSNALIAKCQQQLRDRVAARQWASQALELPVQNLDDEGAAEEARQLLASL